MPAVAPGAVQELGVGAQGAGQPVQLGHDEHSGGVKGRRRLLSAVLGLPTGTRLMRWRGRGRLARFHRGQSSSETRPIGGDAAHAGVGEDVEQLEMAAAAGVGDRRALRLQAESADACSAVETRM